MNIFGLFLKASFLVKITILILISFSIVSWAIIINKIFIFRGAFQEMELFGNKFWSGIEFSRLYKESYKQRENLIGSERIFYSGFKEFILLRRVNNYSSDVIIAGTSRAMHISMNCELESLESYISLLDTIGSIAPYIGLLGTVCGIMHTFILLGSMKQATLQMIAPGIAEALITTAIALFTAIPAVMFYNYLNQRINKLEIHYENFIEEFIAILYRQAFAGIEYKGDLE